MQCFDDAMGLAPAANPGNKTVNQRIAVPSSWLKSENFLFQYSYYSLQPNESDQAAVAFRNQGFDGLFCVLNPDIFQWSSSKTSVATVGSDGLITGKAPGSSTVTARMGNAFSLLVSVEVEGETGVWKKTGGKWWFQLNDGSYPCNQWAQIDGDWYHFDRSGYMQTGWLKLGKTWYYLKGSGAMAEGWQKVSGTWYYLNLGSGAMATGWKKVDGAWYYLKGSGAMAKGWQKVDGQWYYLASSGAMAKSQWVGNYYLTGSGAMATNTWIGKYHVNANGVWDQTR